MGLLWYNYFAMMEDRRRYKRLNAEGTVIIKPEDGTSRTIKADLINISFMGITTVYVKEKIKPGTYVKFELISKLWNEPVICKGKIIHTGEIKKYGSNVFRMGIEFIDFDKKAIQNILNLFQANILAEARKGRSKRNPFIDKQSWL